jgi:uncharacterized membrane protein YdjX (TVP38/TMEM64 family)
LSPVASPERKGGIVSALRRVPRKAWLRMALLLAILATGFLLVRFTPLGGLFNKDRMIALLDGLRASPWSPALLIGLYVILAPLGLPMSPLLAAGGVVFGPVWGSLYNTLGLLLGAMSAYVVGKALGRDFIVHLAGPRLRRVERAFERRGFWPLVQMRFLPIPFWLVSYGAAMAGVKVPRFALTSTLGLIPATVMHTYFLWRVVTDPTWLTGVLYLACWGTFVVVTGWPTFRDTWRRRRRYRELTERRQERPDSPSTR